MLTNVHNAEVLNVASRLARAAVGIAMALALMLIASCGEAKSDAVLTDSGLEITPMHMNLERVVFGQSTTGLYKIKNTSDQPKRLMRIGPANCSCTTLTLHLPDRPNFDSRKVNGGQLDITLEPNERAELEVVFDTSRNRRSISRRTDSFALIVEGSRGMILQYSVDVWTPFWLEPWSLDLGRVGATARAQGFASVKAHDEQDFELIVPEQIDGWEINVRTIEGASVPSFNIEFQAPEALPIGPFQISIPVRTDLQHSPELTLQVTGVATPDVDWTPRKVVLRPDTNGKSKQTVNLGSTSAVIDVILTTAVLTGLPEGLVQVRSEALQAGRSYVVQLDVAQAPAERLEGELLLILDSEDTPQIRIPVVVLPRPE
jgi:hypothetical protein